MWCIRKVLTAVAVIGGLAVSTTPSAGQTSKEKLRVGTYDSRAVAVAYAQSASHRQEMMKMNADFEQAKAARDEKRIKEMEAQGRASQARLHQQGFSTGSVVNILERIKSDLPGVAKEAGVVMLVSKWEVVHADPSIEYIDVTMPLVMRFKPSETTLKMIEQMKSSAPIPLEKLPPETDY